ncbi:MAG TPA: EthD family reductase [Paucimonas sp.]|nr:EthD family reductase [Paucimonas sp.]
MIRVSAFYETRPDATFDHDYYVNKHFPMVLDLMKPFGAIRFEVEKPLAMASGEAVKYAAVGTIYFNDLQGVQAGLARHGAQILDDTKNYTNLSPTIQFGEIV